MARTYYHTFYRKDDVVVEVEFEATPYDPGNTYGLPENCYPPEGGEIPEDTNDDR